MLFGESGVAGLAILIRWDVGFIGVWCKELREGGVSCCSRRLGCVRWILKNE